MHLEICYFGYNAFLIKSQGKTVAIDPGRNLSWFHPKSLIPKGRWPEIDLVLVTHAHPDHCAYAIEICKVSGAPIVCGEDFGGICRGKGLDPVVLRPGMTRQCEGINLVGIRTHHGPAVLSRLSQRLRLPFKLPLSAAGSVGYLIELCGLKILSLGDTMMLDSWQPQKPHVFLAPIGGKVTLSAREALLAAGVFDAGLVIPCHYNCPLWFFKRLLRADPNAFCRRALESGRKAAIIKENECMLFEFDSSLEP